MVELDRSLEANLRGVLAPFDNVELHIGDALDLDLAAFEPAPNKMVANLPYGVAATVILRTVAELPSIRSWVVMVQREVGERFAAAPGSAAYGVPSVLAQLECDVKVLRPVSATGVPSGSERRFRPARSEPSCWPASQHDGDEACP